MGLRCPSCGEDNRDGAPFCGMCKAVLTRARPAPASERTQSYREPPASGSTERALVFLDPSHPGPIELESIASTLELQLADARMRVGFAAPVPVLACSDIGAAARAAAALARAGLRAHAVASAELQAAPPEQRATALAHDRTSLAFQTSRERGHFEWRDLRAAFLVVDTRFELGLDAPARAAMRRGHALLDEVEQRRGTWGARRRLDQVDEILRDNPPLHLERTELTLHLIGDGATGSMHVVVPRTGFHYQGDAARAGDAWVLLLEALTSLAPHVTLDRRAELAAPRLPMVVGLGDALGGRVPPAAQLYGAFLAWRATR